MNVGLKKYFRKTKFNPQSPYALSKSIAYYLTKYYRDTLNYGFQMVYYLIMNLSEGLTILL